MRAFYQQPFITKLWLPQSYRDGWPCGWRYHNLILPGVKISKHKLPTDLCAALPSVVILSPDFCRHRLSSLSPVVFLPETGLGKGKKLQSIVVCCFFFSLHFVESFLPQMVFIKNQTKNINSKNTANYKLPSPTDRGKLNAWCVLGIDLRCHGTAVLSVWGSKDSSKVFRRQKEHTWIWLPCSEKRWKIRLG